MFLTTLTYMAYISTALFAIKLLLLLLGTDSDSGDSSDLIHDPSSDISFKLLSLQTVVAFLMGFSWLGKACLEEWNLNKASSILLASLFGLFIAGTYILTMKLIFKLNSSKDLSYKDCLNKTGVVYMTIPKKGKGQVEVSCNGKLIVVDAMAEEEIEISSSVKIIEILGSTLKVQRNG